MRRLLTALVLSSLLTSAALGTTIKEKGKESVQRKVKELKREKANLSFNQALEALSYTDRAILLLHQGKKEEALKLLSEAQKNIENLIKMHPQLQLLPLSQQIVVMEYPGTLKDAEKEIEKAKELLNKGKVQDARLILTGLTDEIDVITTYLPLAMYDQVVKLAQKYIKAGKIDEALDALSIIRGSLVIDEVAIPIPFIKASQYLKEAEKYLKSDKKKAIKLLEAAKTELQLAKVLGYAYDYTDTYKELIKEIKTIEENLKEGKETSSLIKKLEEKVKELGKKAQTERKK
ncbi:YfdX family protein [Thermovibrio sp.]